MKKGVLSVTFFRLIGLVVFLIILALANSFSWNNSIYLQILEFLNQNIGIIILFSLLLYLGELFFLFEFPINTPAPLFNAFGGIFLVSFIFRIFYQIEEFVNQEVFSVFYNFLLLILLIVFFVILIFGYVKVFSRIERKENGKKEFKKEEVEDVKWKDIGNEFKRAFYNLGRTFRIAFEPKKKDNKKERKNKRRK